MAARQFLSAAFAAVLFTLAGPIAIAEPAKVSCSAPFTLSDALGSFASGDVRDGVLERLYVEMGPSRAVLTTKGDGVSGAYKTKTPDLMVWRYMSIYQPVADWLQPGRTRLDYSGFRIRWPEFQSGGKPLAATKLTVTQGDQTMTVDIAANAKGAAFNDRVFAIDFEAMLAGRYPALRVNDHKAWRAADEAGHPISIVLTDSSNGKIVARGQAPPIDGASLQPLLSGGLNAMRDAYKTGACR